MSERMQINVKHRGCGEFCSLHSVAIGLLAFALMEWLSFDVGYHIYFLVTFVKAICGKKIKGGNSAVLFLEWAKNRFVALLVKQGMFLLGQHNSS